MKKYTEINKEAWNIKTEAHIDSEFYANEDFLNGKNTLNDIELNLLGDLKGKKVLHLQCHFGQDSISLTRLGAEVTAIDLSDIAIERAKTFSKQLGTNVDFICCDVYDLPQYLDKQFDIVYTSYGVIGWLPDMNKWAEVISHFLKPRGKFVFVEFHPIVWMFDDEIKDVAYNYFNAEEIRETILGSYANREAEIEYQTVNWNHSLGEVLSSLINQNITIKALKEYDYSVYNCFNNTTEYEKGRYRIKHLGNKIPLMYSLVGEKI